MRGVLTRRRCHCESTAPGADLFDHVDRLPGHRAEEMMRVYPGIRQELHGFQTVRDRNWVRLMQFWRQISDERETTHFCAVAFHILQSPSRVGGMPILSAQRRLKERMSPTDAGIHKRNVTRIGIVAICRPARKLIDPLCLFVHRQAVKEICGDGWSSKGANAAKSADGLGELIAIGLHDQDGIFGKLQPIRTHSHAIVGRRSHEGFSHLRLEPNFPDSRKIRRWKFVWRAAPEGTKASFGNCRHALD